MRVHGVRPCCFVALCWALWLWSAAAQSSSSSSSSSSLSSSDSSSSNGTQAGDETKAETLAQEWFEANSDANVTYLAVGVNSALSNITGGDVICGEGVPSLQRRTPEELPNNGCPAIFTALNGSCTCLTGYKDSDSWEFFVTARTTEDEYPLTMNATDVLPIDMIRTLLIPSTVVSISITGVGDEPQPITFVPQDVDLPGSDIPIAVNDADTSDATSITAVRLENIDMSSIVLNVGYFFPTTTLNLTMRNCGLEKFGYDFFQGLNSVEYLDFSENNLATAYAGNTIGNTCTTQFCAVQILNLTGNVLTSFPSVVFNLDDLSELYIRNNNITDFNVSASIFTSILALRAYESDEPDKSATCTGGAWQTAHNVTFCVLDASTATTDSSSGTSFLVYVAIAAGVVVVVLLVTFVWMKWGPRSDLERLSSSPKNDSTGASHMDETRQEVSRALLEDPVIVTNRIEYRQLRLGKCISKGGFGLVFTGEYKGRRVAIKKIRPDRSGDVSEIDVFLKEIIMMAVLYHPRIVEFIGVAWDNLRHLAAVTEFMDNGDLREVLYTFKERGSPLSWETHKTAFALHIAEALTYLHSQHPKVIHRDLKSKNVLLNLYYEAKLSDFGISRMRYDIETHMTAGVGTSFWIAPEVLLGRDYDERADIYSFGVVLSEIDTNDYPYWNDNNPNAVRGKMQEAEILNQVAMGQMRPEFSIDCPEEILALADACLQKTPQNRPTAAEIVGIIQNLMHPSRSRQSSQDMSDDSGSIWSVQSPSNIIL
ncbi:TKL protein kinase [Phytophthora cinnamomi]|uniref:TKL protein kinase n=1 Tax=Phytophthora cinnamomi TaxID=4785 RepID=UPI003559B466|nr:TKL protein kinase [Phytophthora cinnamomi]